MALTFTVESGSGSASATSYTSVATADDFIALNKHETAWTSATNAQKENALMRATLILDDNVVWYGSMANSNQALQWPRLGVFDKYGNEIDFKTIQSWLKNATAELARTLHSEDRDADPDTLGFSSLSVRSLSIGVDKSDRRHVLPGSVIRMVNFYGRVQRAGGTIRLVRV